MEAAAHRKTPHQPRREPSKGQPWSPPSPPNGITPKPRRSGVLDSGPIIHLNRVGLLDLLPTLYGSIVVPRAVFDEVVHDGHGQPGSTELASATWTEIIEHDPNDALFRGFLRILQLGE